MERGPRDDMEPLKIGSDEHGRLFCQTFIDTHRPFEAKDIVWPQLDEESLTRLKNLPVWDEAARTEAATAVKVQTLGETETDPILKEAIALQGYEEGRHAEIINLLTKAYGIPTAAYGEPERPKNPTWTFLRTGYGECLDSFFAFGLFDIGRRTEYFHKDIVDLFDHIMQEEARHILFIVNWAAYLRARRPLPLRPAFDARRAWNIVAQAFDRVKGAMQMAGGNGDGKGEGKSNGNGAGGEAKKGTQDGFTLKSHTAFGDFKLRSFLELCLAENERRLSVYDPRLLRPTLVPGFVKLFVKVLPKGR
ncbi:MAG TPA: ferritin-like domain-containing protein [Thermoanaerobaculia bacterium]|nr:ferritin-like domain-containing protein [Thermoanaerobaculia bacterium]